MRRVLLMFGCLAGMYAGHAIANNAAAYCNDMYPAGSYDPAERATYVSECLDSYSGYEAEEDTQSNVSEPQTYEQPPVTEPQISEDSWSESQSTPAEPEYYEGTVEDYVNSGSEPAESGNYE